MAIKQRRGSIAYRFSLKPQLSDSPIVLTPNGLRISSSALNESPHNGHDPSPVPYLDANLSSAQNRVPEEEHVNGTNNLPMKNLRTTLKSSPTNNETKNGPLTNEKNSSTCTIQ